jgi:hypothetical protein
LKVFLTDKIDNLNSLGVLPKNLTIIDVNFWFKNNSLSPQDMNEIRQYIFNEWITKKVSSIKIKEDTDLIVAVIYEKPSDEFIFFLKEKFLNNFGNHFYDIVLVEEKN